jgi:hypothetical protein
VSDSSNSPIIVGPGSGRVKLFSRLNLLEFTGLTQVYTRPHNFPRPCSSPFRMSFDEELERTLDALADRLHGEVARQVRAVASDLSAAATADRAALARPVAEAIADPAPADVAIGRLADAVRALSQARSLSEILETLVNESGRIASRVALVLVRGDRFQGWRFLGFELSSEPHRSFDLARAEAGVIAAAADSGVLAASGGAPAFARLSSDEPCLALPLAIGGDVVAVMYVDDLELSDAAGSGAANRERLDVLALHASRCLEALTAIKAAAAFVAAPGRTAADAADDDGQYADVNLPTGSVAGEEKARV